MHVIKKASKEVAGQLNFIENNSFNLNELYTQSSAKYSYKLLNIHSHFRQIQR